MARYELSGFLPRVSAAAIALGLCASVGLSGVCSAASLKVVFSQTNEQQAGKLLMAYKKHRRGTTVTPIFLGNGVDFASAVEKKPDIYMGLFAEMGNWADIGLFEDVGKVLGPQVLRDYPADFLNAFAVGKRLLGIPVAGYTTQLCYNPSMFKQVGLPKPDASWSWEGKFYEAAKKLSRDSNGDGNMEQFGIAGMTCNQFGNPGMPSPHFLSMIYSYGGGIVDSKFTKAVYTDKPSMNAINFLIRMHKEKLADMTDYTYEQGNAAEWPFYSGRDGMMLKFGSGKSPIPFEGSWEKGKAPKFQADYSVIPKGPKGTIPSVMTQVACLMKTSKDKKEAAEFLKFLSSLEGQKAMFDAAYALPTTKAGFGYKKVSDTIGMPMMKAYQKGKAWSARKGYIDIEFSLWDDVRKIANGEGTMQELIENAKSRVPEIIGNSTYSF